uniref:Alkaline phosphatase n=1 Tax=Diatraea saccharalis TaxID=40085 RepID=I6PF06_9NEOP|nr:alkaline phosphatase 1 [Diatraea saccharalis]
MLSAQILVLFLVSVALADRYHPDAKGLGKLKNARTGVGPSAAEKTAQYWYNEALNGINKRQARLQDDKVARNTIMFLGDGMSVPTLAAARTLLGQRQGLAGEEAELSFESFPTVGLAKTYCVDHQIADSACTATAYLCGVKNNYGTLGVTGEVSRNDCPASENTNNQLESIAAWALKNGKDVGIVTTTRITHASPSGAYARTANRNWEHNGQVQEANFDPTRCPDIAHQLIHTEPGKSFKVILGGGRRNFIPNSFTDEEGQLGLRTDQRNLINEWRNDKNARNLSNAYIWNRDQLMANMQSPPEYLLGLFESDHLQYNLEADKTTEPTLTELTEIAIRSLNRNEKGFFLFVEGGRIDHAHHDNYVHLALDETIELSKAVERSMGLLPEDDTLIVVTADHAHVMAFNGYTQRGGDILGPSDSVDSNDIRYKTISYTNGPGAREQIDGVRPDVFDEDNAGDTRWRAHADVPLGSETHGGDDVAVFARGPHHHMFAGLYEQSQIPHLMAYAGCFDTISENPPHCNTAHALRSPLLTVLFIVVVSLVRTLFR